jgi:hypothetical protein
MPFNFVLLYPDSGAFEEPVGFGLYGALFRWVGSIGYNKKEFN